jgi:biopolymer transport protein ExbD
MSPLNHDDDEVMSDINITPLVDIMLVLLITFMLVSILVDFSALISLRGKNGNGGSSKLNL